MQEISLSYEPPLESQLMSVSIAGTFNNWSVESHQMKKQKNGIWTLKFHLEPGRHLYKIVENQTNFIADPMNPLQESDG